MYTIDIHTQHNVATKHKPHANYLHTKNLERNSYDGYVYPLVNMFNSGQVLMMDYIQTSKTFA